MARLTKKQIADLVTAKLPKGWTVVAIDTASSNAKTVSSSRIGVSDLVSTYKRSPQMDGASKPKRYTKHDHVVVVEPDAGSHTKTGKRAIVVNDKGEIVARQG